MDTKSIVALVAGLLVSIGGIVVAAPTWPSLLTPGAVGGVCMVIGGTLATAFGVSAKRARPEDF